MNAYVTTGPKRAPGATTAILKAQSLAPRDKREACGRGNLLGGVDTRRLRAGYGARIPGGPTLGIVEIVWGARAHAPVRAGHGARGNCRKPSAGRPIARPHLFPRVPTTRAPQ